MESIYQVIVAIRLPFTTFDLIVAGMLCAHIYKKYVDVIKNYKNVISAILIGVIACYPFFFYYYSIHIGLYGMSTLSSAGQSLIGLFIALILFGMANMPFGYESVCGKMIQFVGRYEYGIYLWHMILMGNFMNFGPDWYLWLNERYPFVLLMIILAIAIVIGYWSDRLTYTCQTHKM